MKSESRRIIALLLLLVAITGLVMSFGEKLLCAGELPGAHESATVSHGHAAQETEDCPCAPSPSHSPDGHYCIDDCGCPCNAPLPSTAISITYSRSFTYLHYTELTRHIPEVYLSLFVPPDSATV